MGSKKETLLTAVSLVAVSWDSSQPPSKFEVVTGTKNSRYKNENPSKAIATIKLRKKLGNNVTIVGLIDMPTMYKASEVPINRENRL